MWNVPRPTHRLSPDSNASATSSTSTESEVRPTRTTWPVSSMMSPSVAGVSKSMRSQDAVTKSTGAWRAAVMKATLSICDKPMPPNSVP